ncbi:shootin-1 [Thalassophryne amazonica]|uniref:shootin-1 n=1 Tax=Thalassophryne amazonica TaxID=390379 RepID=UPI0014717E37|nr:shootin-1 [Thalassophryne amazonica]
MAAEERDRIPVITALSSKAVQEYEGLQRKHQTAAIECKQLEEERDEALKKLSEFQQVSHMVIEEVTAIQESLEIERTCRESAEALASKLNQQNCSLKRKSMLLLSHLSPETIAEINLKDEDREEEDEDVHTLNKICLSPDSRNMISELQNKLELTQKEKNLTVSELQAVKEQLKQTTEELLKEKNNNMDLFTEVKQLKKVLRKYSQVSQFAVEEYNTLQDTLELERDLRTEAENFAREMVVEQREMKRQSQILMQNYSPSQALQEALNQVAKLTQDLETERLEHQHQVKQMDEKLSSCEAQKELTALIHKLELMEFENQYYMESLSKSEEKVKDLHFTVEELNQKLQTATNPPPAPPPPPPPPPPLPTPESSSNPLSALLLLIRKKRNISVDIPLVDQDTKSTDINIRQQAVEEMMQRIKKGVQLRPISQSRIRTRQVKQLPPNSAIEELKGIMENFNRNSSKLKPKSPSASCDDELQRILLRRRDAVESQHNASLTAIVSPPV